MAEGFAVIDPEVEQVGPVARVDWRPWVGCSLLDAGRRRGQSLGTCSFPVTPCRAISAATKPLARASVTNAVRKA